MSHYRMKSDPIAPRSKFHDGSYGRLFRGLDAWEPDLEPEKGLNEHFLAYANNNMMEEPLSDDERARSNDRLIPAGYTYFGQFIDHDITFDPTPLGEASADPDRLRNFRTPRLDLDCVYGRGPDDQPYLYDYKRDGRSLRFTGKFMVGDIIKDTKHTDLPRNKLDLAIIGDMRNDENSLVAQVHLAFLLAHNKLVDRTAPQEGKAAFVKARKTLCWLYQWVVWNDFVKRISEREVHKIGLILDKDSLGREEWRLGLSSVFNWKHQPFMPIEFSMAAYRFGHSMVRDSYRTNGAVRNGLQTFIPLFSNSRNQETLRGFRSLSKNSMIQWDWFLPMNSSDGKEGFPQPSRPIDTKLSKALGDIPESGEKIAAVLAARNLVRGTRSELPSGQDIAMKLNVDLIKIEMEEENQLWHYILKEAEVKNDGGKLGEVGSIIVCAVLAGLLKGDSESWINKNPGWTPDSDPLLKEEDKVDGDWELASIIRLSGLPVKADEFQKPKVRSGSGYSGRSKGEFSDEKPLRTPIEELGRLEPL